MKLLIADFKGEIRSRNRYFKGGGEREREREERDGIPNKHLTGSFNCQSHVRADLPKKQTISHG